MAAGTNSAVDPSAALPFTGFTAMVVELDPVRRAHTADRLRSLGAHEVVEADTLAQARDSARRSGPREWGVLDVGPGGPGLDLLADLRALGWQHVLVLSADDDLPEVRAEFLAGLASALRESAGLAAGGVHELSGRELDVLRLVADGHSNKQIGEDLGLSALTVKSHLARMGRKLGTGDRAEMVAHAMRGGVIH